MRSEISIHTSKRRLILGLLAVECLVLLVGGFIGLRLVREQMASGPVSFSESLANPLMVTFLLIGVSAILLTAVVAAFNAVADELERIKQQTPEYQERPLTGIFS